MAFIEIIAKKILIINSSVLFSVFIKVNLTSFLKVVKIKSKILFLIILLTQKDGFNRIIMKRGVNHDNDRREDLGSKEENKLFIILFCLFFVLFLIGINNEEVF